MGEMGELGELGELGEMGRGFTNISPENFSLLLLPSQPRQLPHLLQYSWSWSVLFWVRQYRE